MKFFYGSVVISSLIVLITSTSFDNCSWYGFPPNEVRLENCTETPCTLVLGGNVTGEMDFTAPYDLTVLRPRVTAWAYGMPMEIPIPQEDGCETLISGKCPLKEGDNATYTFSMNASRDDYYYFAGIQATIEFTFVDEYDNVTICASVPTNIEL